MTSLLEPSEIARIEQEFSTGIPARTIVDIFRPRGVKLSEATFRKYVQAGLLPRSRRIGRKGKHRGSTGVYPVATVRRINVIKRMMAEGLTLADIRRSYVYFKNEIDSAAHVLQGLQGDLGRELASRPMPLDSRRRLERALANTRAEATRLVRRLERVGSEIVAAGSPESSRQADSSATIAF